MTNSDLVKASDKLDDRLEGSDINKTVDELINSGKRLRRILNYVIFSIIFEFVLAVSVAVLYTGFTLNRYSIQNNHNSLVSFCMSNNSFRKDNLSIWKYILALPPQPGQTVEQQRVTAEFSKFVNTTFAPRDCSKIK